MSALHLSIRVIHVFLSAFWFGGALLLALFIEPAVTDSGPAGGAVMQALVRRGMPRILTFVGLFAVLTGLYLLWVRSGHFAGGYMGSPHGILISTGALFGLIALLLGVHLTRPSVKALGAIGGRVAASNAPPTPDDLAEMGRLRGRLRLSTRLVAVSLSVAIVCMAFGAHL